MVTQKPLICRSIRNPRSGFTLVEVALAIGIVAFAFVALLALIPAGQTAYRRSIDITVCSQIAQRVIDEANQTDFDALIDQIDIPAAYTTDVNYTFRAPLVTTPTLRYFDDQGREIILASSSATTPGLTTAKTLANAIYVVNTRIQPLFQLPTTGVVTPAGNSSATNSAAPQPLALITVQVAHNPQNVVNLQLSPGQPNDPNTPDRNLWSSTATANQGVEIFTYTGYIGRNL
jgi:uncharacterized protein (TIGR02598 family)